MAPPNSAAKDTQAVTISAASLMDTWPLCLFSTARSTNRAVNTTIQKATHIATDTVVVTGSIDAPVIKVENGCRKEIKQCPSLFCPSARTNYSREWESPAVKSLTGFSFGPGLAVFAFRPLASNKNITAAFASQRGQSRLPAFSCPPARTKLQPRMGVEPTTYGLQNRCSAS